MKYEIERFNNQYSFIKGFIVGVALVSIISW